MTIIQVTKYFFENKDFRSQCFLYWYRNAQKSIAQRQYRKGWNITHNPVIRIAKFRYIDFPFSIHINITYIHKRNIIWTRE
jgi:hypothetical protein